MAGIAFALAVALLLTLACAAPQSAAPTLSPLAEATVPAAVTPTAAGTVVVSPTVPPTPTHNVAPPTATREAATPPPPTYTVASPESPTPPPAAERAAPMPSATPIRAMPSATASAPPAPTATPAVWPKGSTPIAELGLTQAEAVAEIARRYQVSPERVGYQKYTTTILDAAVAPIPDSQDLMLTVTSRLRNYRNLPDGFEIAAFDDTVRVEIYEFEVHLDGYFLYEENSAPIVTQQIRLKSRLDRDGKRIDRPIYINGQPLVENFALNCSDYGYGFCPIGCLESCTPSYCGKDGDTYFCTDDCGGQGSCYRP